MNQASVNGECSARLCECFTLCEHGLCVSEACVNATPYLNTAPCVKTAPCVNTACVNTASMNTACVNTTPCVNTPSVNAACMHAACVSIDLLAPPMGAVGAGRSRAVCTPRRPG